MNVPLYLNNGARVLSYAQAVCGRFYVAAEWHDEYVTWAIDEEGNAFWGHYFDEPGDAFNDLQKRAG
ncbi:MAG: hypothetical protein GWN13_12630 [Phycisphaerae bacterium]|nr:hypothetical protein [Phycisphaerae bacterium]